MKKVIFAIIVVILLGTGGTAFYQKKQVPLQKEEVVVDLLEHQELIETTIQSIVGNEVETEEGETYSIPVGTEVVTKLGNITTFSRLSVGDKVQILIEKKTSAPSILKLWIVE